MALLHFDALPPRTARGTLVRLVTQVGGMDRGRIGAIEIRGRAATMEVPEAWVARLVKALDGAQLGTQHIRAWHEEAGRSGGGEDHFGRLLRLLELEGEAEAEQTRRRLQKLSPQQAEQTGSSLIDLALVDETTGLGGRVLVTLRKGTPGMRLPWTRLEVGSPVLVTVQEGEWEGESCRGVVSQRSEQQIEVAFSGLPEVDFRAGLCRLDHASDEISRQRQRAALHRAAAAKSERLAVLRDVLLGEQAAGFREFAPLAGGGELNESQREAIRFALSAEDVAILHGPPGTGKTTTVVELILQAVRQGERVLACAPSNLAVDNILERLLAAGLAAIRLGHPARVLPALREHTLDLIVDAHEDMRLATKLTRQAYALRDRAARWTRGKPVPGARREQREEAKQLLEDARRLEAQLVRQLLDAAPVLCATLTGVDSELLGQRQFDIVVIDEACQAVEPAAWIPILRGHRVVLAGDHFQLPPTVVSRAAELEGFGISLMERMMQLSGGKLARRLDVQYRMHEHIMAFSSQEFYEGSLIADASVRHHLLADLEGVAADDNTTSPLLFIDTAGAGFDEALEADGDSRLNEGEAGLIQRRVEQLLAAGLEPAQIAVISPYAAQVRHLRELLDISGLEIDTVDGFQGREKEAVLISLVRSNSNGEIGFLSDTRRMNVALTRARRKLIVVGDSATVGRHPFYQRLLESMEQYGAYRSVWEEM